MKKTAIKTSKPTYKDGGGYHYSEPIKGFEVKPEQIMSMNTDNNLVTRQVETISPTRMAEIERANAAMLKQPVTSLGKAGESFIQGRQRFTIIERTPQFMFLEVAHLLYHENTNIPMLDKNRKQLTGDRYWVVGVVDIYQDQRVDGYGFPTGEFTERKEHIRYNPAIVTTVYNERGVSTGEKGYNANKEAVYAKYLEAVEKFQANIKRKDEKQKADEQKATMADKRAKKVAELVSAKSEAEASLKEIIEGNNAGKLLKDKRIIELSDKITTCEAILKYLK